MGALSDQQTSALQITSRVASTFSLVGCIFICLTFVFSQNFRKPINRLVFYASWGNMLMNIATFMSQAGVNAGAGSSLCTFQGFLIQMFLPADAFWNLSMAINVYLTVFRKYTPDQLKSIEWIYLLVNYGGTFIVAFAYCFISTPAKGPMYGPAILWCWISIKWDTMRIALVYGPAWACILITFSIYALAGRDIFQKRKVLRSFDQTEDQTVQIENPFTSYKTTEIHITSELVDLHNRNPSRASHNIDGHQSNLDPNNHVLSNQGYEQYSISIERGAKIANLPAPTMAAQMHHSQQNKAAMEANTAAWGYTKCALLFFVSLLITWVPSSLNRVYSLVYPEEVSWAYSYAAGLVLPLMGFWNAVIYISTSWAAVKLLFQGHASQPRIYHGSANDGNGKHGILTSLEEGSLTARESGDLRSLSDSTKGLAG